MDSLNLILCAASVAALDICILVLIITAYREKKSSNKRWRSVAHSMELAEQGAVYTLGCDEVIIGRHASADVRLPDLSVSRYHALLTVSNGIWTITDIGSKSEVFVNGNLVKQARLYENDIIKLGNRRLIFRRRREQYDK